MDSMSRVEQEVPGERSKGLFVKRLLGWARSVLPILLVILLLVMARLVFLRYLDQSALQRFVHFWGIIAPLAFILITVVVVLLFAPPLLPIGLGALSFGSASGAGYSLIGITAGACLAFLIGRYCISTIPLRLKAGKLKRRLERVDALIARHAFLTIIGLRLALYSNAPLNYLVGSTSVTMRDYVFGTLLGLIPQTFLLSYAFNIVVTSVSFEHLLKSPHLFLLLAPHLIRVLGVLILGAVGRQCRRERNWQAGKGATADTC